MAKAGASGFTFHVEVSKDYWQELVHKINSKDKRPGVALKPQKHVEEVYPLLEGENPVEMVLVMAVEPGVGGKKFMPEMMDKVRTLRHKYPSLDIEVDGGLRPSTIDMAAKHGQTIFLLEVQCLELLVLHKPYLYCAQVLRKIRNNNDWNLYSSEATSWKSVVIIGT